MFAGLESNPAAESFFRDFLSFSLPLGTYQERLGTVVGENKRRLVVNLDDLRAFDAQVARAFIRDPNQYLPHWEKVVQELVKDPARFPPQDKEGGGTATGVAELPLLGFDGALGGNWVTPRGLTSGLLRQLVLVEGIVTKGSLVKPKIVSTVQYNPRTERSFFKSFRDATSSFGLPTPAVFMSVDPDTKDPLSMEFGLCLYKDHQSITVQEMPEKAPAGQLPRSVEVILDDDLADAAKPGDRVQVVGVYRALPSAHDGRSKGVFRSVLVANNVRLVGRDKQSGQMLTPTDVENILRVGAGENVFEKLAGSLAPSIYGHDYVKRALLLQLLGGGEKNLANGTHIRGDINVMLIGDPSTAKSQLLRFVLNIAPLAVSTSGRGSSGVGLTAAVTTDPETRERRLEAGAMVLADRGVVCIDEFDKMSEDDRVAIHEVMEQGACTINKAGIHTSLNARCSVLAAANPVYGQYNRQKKPSENIALPDSLLSRFDLMFIVLDNLDPAHDRAISSHVLKMHMYRRADDNAEAAEDEQDVVGTSLINGDGSQQNTAKETPVTHRFAHGARDGEEVFTVEFIKKYLMYAKARIAPALSQEAASHITSKYAELRSKEDTKTLPVTPRTLETLIRLTIAHAKCRLSRVAELSDAVAACDVMNFALYNEVRGNDAQPPPLPGDRPVPVNRGDNEAGQKRAAEREGGEEEIGDKRAREEEEQPSEAWIAERLDDRARRCRKLFKKCLADRKQENCEMQELLRWMDADQAVRGAKYRPWTAEEVWEVLEAWAAEEDPNGVMVERSVNEIFSL